jgi:hypothetical protein
MKFTHHALPIELNDDWWVEAGMPFVPTSKAYRTSQSFCEGAPISVIRIADVGPADRPVGIFRDSSEGVPARERVVRILVGFRRNEAIPPVEVVENRAGSAHRYKLTKGAHRFYCSLAAGFTHVPSIEGFDWARLDPGKSA